MAILSTATHRVGAAGEHAGHSHCPLHFEHPLVAESPSPDTKLRSDYRYFDRDTATEHTVFFEGEYAFNCNVSIGVEVPYTFLDPDTDGSKSNLNNTEIFLKTASYRFADRGWLLGGGLELGLPTGDDAKGIGSNNELEVEPFLSAGYKRGRFESVAFLTFGIPANQDPEEADEVDLELGWNVSLIYHHTSRFLTLVELDGETIAAGDADETVLNVSPGIKYRPFPDEPLSLGLGIGFPVTDDEAFDTRVFASAFYHF